jgi:lysine 6-dehydrogenase
MMIGGKMNMRAAVLGTGMIGGMIVKQLARSEAIDEVLAIDAVQASLDRCLQNIDSEKVKGQVLALTDGDNLKKTLQTVDVAIACLPHSLSLFVTETAIEAGCNLIDLVGSKFSEKLEFDKRAKEAGVLIVPGCGVAPGLTNILAARGIELLDDVDEVVMVCGGIPRHPLPPLWYQVVFRLESVMGLYTRPALAAENGELIKLPPLSGLEDMEFPAPVGLCEAVVTDAHSVAYTLKGKANRIVEKTVRYKGHWSKMATLGELGFLDEEPVLVDGSPVSPRKLTMALLEPKMKGASNEDITVLRVSVTGTKSGKAKKLEWEMVDLYDKDRNLTSMAKTTGFPPVILTEWLARKQISKTGIVAPECLLSGSQFDDFVRNLEGNGIDIKFNEWVL